MTYTIAHHAESLTIARLDKMIEAMNHDIAEAFRVQPFEMMYSNRSAPQIEARIVEEERRMSALPFLGVPIRYATHAVKATDERLFPESKHRSARIKKKLIKRFGSEFRMVPCVWYTPQGIIMHPSFKVEFEHRTGKLYGQT